MTTQSFSPKVMVECHLASNFYPPLPTGYADSVLAAVDACNEGEPYRRIILPDVEPTPMGATIDAEDSLGAPADYLVRIFRVESMIEEVDR